MSLLVSKLTKLFDDESGATAIEYGLIMGLMTLALVAGLSNLGDSNSGKWDHVASEAAEAHNS